MRTISMALWATAALAISGVAAAEGPAWTYVDGGYFRADNSSDDDTDGFRLGGSLGLADMGHVQLQYFSGTIGDGTGGGQDQDFDGYRIIGGLNPHVSDSTDAVLNLQYFDLTYDDFCGAGCDADLDGFGVGAGLRHMLTDKLEVSGIAWWNDGSFDPDVGGNDFDVSDSSLELGGRYLFTDNLSVGVNFITNDQITQGDSATLDVRWQFDDVL